MRRREFITFLGGTPAWVDTARAQEPRRVIGLLSSITFDSYPGAEAAMARGLENTGFVEDKNISIIRRSADGQHNRLPSLANELVRRGVAVIVSGDAPAAFAAKAATSNIPIVFGTGDVSPAASLSKDRRGTCARQVTPYLPGCCLTSFCALQPIWEEETGIAREAGGRQSGHR